MTNPHTSGTACDMCGHAWRRHDPEDGMCDAPRGEHADPDHFGCQCGRDLNWMQRRIAALSTHALGGGNGA